jgi:hypothetical protein
VDKKKAALVGAAFFVVVVGVAVRFRTGP